MVKIDRETWEGLCEQLAKAWASDSVQIGCALSLVRDGRSKKAENLAWLAKRLGVEVVDEPS